MLVLGERGKPEYLLKNLWEQSSKPTNSNYLNTCVCIHEDGRDNLVDVPYLPVYNMHFFFVKLTFKFAMRIIHGSHCLVTFSLAYHKQENQSLAVNGFYLL